MKKDNRGLSLVELIVVISIMVILTGLVTATIGVANKKPADECIAKIYATLQDLRVSSMGKYNAYGELYVGSNGQIYIKETLIYDDSGNQSEIVRVVGAKGVSVTVDGTVLTSSSTPVKIEYDRSSGAFKTAPGTIYAAKGSRSLGIKLNKRTGKMEKIDW